MSAKLPPVSTDSRSIGTGAINVWVNRLSVYGMVVILLLVGPVISAKFYSLTNLTNILQEISLLGIVSAGVAFVTYAGQYADLSVPSTMAFSGIISVVMLRYGIVVSLLVGICFGILIGLINAFAVGKYRVNPVIWTLALNFLLNGIMQWGWGSNQVYVPTAGAGSTFLALSNVKVGPVPLNILVFLVTILVMHIVLSRTKFGRQLKIVGSSRDVAKLTGINVSWSIGTAFLLSAFTAAIAGIFLTSLVQLGVYYNGQGYDFQSVTAVVIGGITLAGGRGNIIGVLGGVLIIGLLNNLMALIGLSTFYQGIVQGVIFILVVGLSAYSLRKLGRDDT